MKKRSGNIKGKAEQPLVRQMRTEEEPRQSAITKLPIIPIAETFSQGRYFLICNYKSYLTVI